MGDLRGELDDYLMVLNVWCELLLFLLEMKMEKMMMMLMKMKMGWRLEVSKKCWEYFV